MLTPSNQTKFNSGLWLNKRRDSKHPELNLVGLLTSQASAQILLNDLLAGFRAKSGDRALLCSKIALTKHGSWVVGEPG